MTGSLPPTPPSSCPPVLPAPFHPKPMSTERVPIVCILDAASGFAFGPLCVNSSLPDLCLSAGVRLHGISSLSTDVLYYSEIWTFLRTRGKTAKQKRRARGRKREREREREAARQSSINSEIHEQEVREVTDGRGGGMEGGEKGREAESV